MRDQYRVGRSLAPNALLMHSPPPNCRPRGPPLESRLFGAKSARCCAGQRRVNHRRSRCIERTSSCRNRYACDRINFSDPDPYQLLKRQTNLWVGRNCGGRTSATKYVSTARGLHPTSNHSPAGCSRSKGARPPLAPPAWESSTCAAFCQNTSSILWPR